jgi:hypothetical protein
MPQQFRQVSGGNCRLVLFRESSAGTIATGDDGVIIDFYSESLAENQSKTASTVISAKRGQGKPIAGAPEYTGNVECSPYAPLIGHILRSLCGAPTSTGEAALSLSAAPVSNEGEGCVGLPASSNPFVQDACVTITGTANYNGVYRLEYGTSATKLVIRAKYIAETLTTEATATRGRGAFLHGAVVDKSSGSVGLPVAGMGVSLHAGESITISGTTNYDGEHVLKEGTQANLLVIAATYTAETLDGTATALPKFFKHHFILPNRQPSVAIEKYLDFEADAAKAPYTLFGFCKLNGLSFSFGGNESEIKLSLEYSVGRAAGSATAHSAAPAHLPAIPFYNKEAALWLGDKRLSDIESGSVELSYGIEGKVAVGDMGKRSRQTEGDAASTVTLTAFLEHDDYHQLAEAATTQSARISLCGANGEEFWIILPESEVDASSPSIQGKEGITAEIKLLGFVEQATSINEFTLINRVASYA